MLKLIKAMSVAGALIVALTLPPAAHATPRTTIAIEVTRLGPIGSFMVYSRLRSEGVPTTI